MNHAHRVICASLAAIALSSCFFDDDRKDVGGFVDNGIADTSSRNPGANPADEKRALEEAMTIRAGSNWALDGRRLNANQAVRLGDLDRARTHRLGMGGRDALLHVGKVSAVRMDLVKDGVSLGEIWGLPTRRVDARRLSTLGTTINYKGKAWTRGPRGPLEGELVYRLDLAKGSAMDSGHGTITGIDSLPGGVEGVSRIELDGWKPLEIDEHRVTGGGMAHLKFKDATRNPERENKTTRPDNKTSFLYSFRLMGDSAEEIAGGLKQDLDDSTPRPDALPGGPYSVPFHGMAESRD